MKLIIDIEPRYCKDMRSDVKGLYYEAINRIIEAVSNGIPYDEKPQGDLVSRGALKKHIAETFEIEEKIDKKWAMGLKYSLKIIDKAPAVEPQISPEVLNQFAKYVATHERPQGEWITIDAFVVKCSVCGVESFATPFCPRCGADMRDKE